MAVAVAVVLAAGSAACSGPRPATQAMLPVARAVPATPPGPVPWPRSGWVRVPVATVWSDLGKSRPVDAAAVAAEPDVAGWLAGLSVPQRLDLDDRLATQALMYDPLVVLGEQGAWAHVLVSQQRGGYWRDGIGGWVPAAQVTFDPPPDTGATVTVAAPQLAVDTGSGARTLSYGTQLPVIARSASAVEVQTAYGTTNLAPAAVRDAALPRSGAAVVREAARFMGLPYLWAGTSSFGFDCSGLTYMVYRQFGVVLPRDAQDQMGAGTPVDKADLRPGDLVFYDFGTGIDHVGIYAGNGQMLDSPETGKAIEVVPMWGTPLAAYFAGARRYL